MIPDEQVEEVRARADIVDVISEFVALKKAGREYKANCPFHEERTPSFYVAPDKGFYKCFGCGKSGDVFSFLMERQGLDFVEAVRYVAARAGVELRETKRRPEEDDPNRPLYEINAFAREWFRGRLLDETGGAAARAYLERRGVSPEIAERFGLGWAPDEWRALREAAAKHGLDEELMLELGLLGRSERSPEAYDRFRGRVIFPIESLAGRVIAFGGRVIGDRKDAPKYLNSPESPIYHKGLELYGLSWARHAIRREGVALVVEGYMDAVSLAAHGLEHVVAPLGTALTPEQASLLTRFTTRVVLLFDSDPAGLKATFRAADVLLEAGLHPAVATLPEGEDPDTIVRTQGPDALARFVDQAVDVMDRKLRILEERNHFASIEHTRAALDRLLPTIRAAADPALRDIYVKKVSDRTGVRRETIEAELERDTPRRGGPPAATRRAAGPGMGAIGGAGGYPTTMPRLPRAGAERKLLVVMVRGVEWVERAAELVSPEDFADPHHRAIFEALLDDPDLRAPTSTMDPATARRFEDILADPEEISHGIDVFTRSVNRLRVLALDRRVQELQRRIEAAAHDEEKLDLTRQKAALARELRELDPTYWGSATRKPRIDHSHTEPNP